MEIYYKGVIYMRIIIAGSRDFNDYNKIKSETLKIIDELNFKDYNTKRENVEIVSGTARGADQLGERFAKEFNLGLARFLQIGIASGRELVI